MSRSTRLAGIAAAVALCALVALPAWSQAPLRVGATHPLTLDSAGPSDVEAAPTPSGKAYRLHHPGATYLALHFAAFDLAPGEWVRISDARGEQAYVLRGKGKMEAGTFWARHVKGDTLLLEHGIDEASPGRGFRVDQYAAGAVPLDPLGPDTEAICGLDDKRNAVCYQGSHPTEYTRGRAVARLLIQGTSLCTGWLVSAQNHLLTNQHCISSATAAMNTDYEFAAEAPNCNDGNCQLCHPGDVYSGATFIQDSAALDYALVQIGSGDPASLYGFLEIDDRPAVLGEEIYIPQYPGGRAKELGIVSTDLADGPDDLCHVNSVSEPPCSGSGYNDVGYFCDTEGGSSGSPVLARSSHKVIALHHCAFCENRGVPITLVCAEICGLLGPGCGNGTCEAGEDCFNCAQDCEITDPGARCGNGVCEAGNGEDCVSCAADCNGRQSGKPANRYCCGDGDGQNPVPCSDGRCSSGGRTCTDVPVNPGTACCGDAVCEAGVETCGNCALDCNLGPEVCDSGIDEDCDGDVDCADGECANLPVCQSACDGDAVCDPGEDCNTCPSDCDGKLNGRPSGRYCCGNGILEGPEGDGRCDGNP